MTTTSHRRVEAQFRELLLEADLPEPDDVGYGPESVVFYWHEPKLAVVVDFDEDDVLAPVPGNGSGPE